MKRRRWLNNKFLVLLILTLGLAICTHLFFNPLVLAQNADTFFSERIISFLVENTKRFSVGFADANTDRMYSSNSKDQSFDIKDLGKLVLRSESNVDLPENIGLTGNRGTAEASFSLNHELE